VSWFFLQEQSVLAYIYFSLDRRAKCYDQRMSISVCLFVRSHISKTACPNFLYVLPACGRGSCLILCEIANVFLQYK